MTPIFDAGLRLAGFFDGTYLFDLDNEWVAFRAGDDVFATDGRWLGPLLHDSFLDMDGRPVAWLAGGTPTSGARPRRPMDPRRPLHPKRPLRPRTPLPPPVPLSPATGWSSLSWGQWMGQAPLAAGEADVASFEIQAVADTDLAALFGYLGEQLAENGRDGAWFMPLAPTDAGLPADVRRSFADGLAVAVGAPGWRRCWIARDALGAVAGHVDLRGHARPFTGHRALLGLGVRRDLRRRGLAARLLAHAAQWAPAQGLRWFDLDVLANNAPALSFYRREGFTMQSGSPDMYVVDGTTLGEIRMARKLA